MSISLSSKKVAFAALMVTPLLLTACGSDSSDTEAASSSAATTTNSSSSSAATSAEAAETTSSESESSEATTINEEQQAQLDVLSQELSENPITFAEAAPVENGETASPEDTAAIEALVRGYTDTNTLRSSLAYTINNTCTRVLEASGADATQLDLNTIPDIPLGGEGTGTVDSITDVVVNGQEASAWVVATAGGTTDSATQRFFNEGGQWKFCD
ncbi:putative secreted protein [Corynebacterium glutamicum MB001]|uniref:Secreted protein n=1 Tax=Corynebacterium glutamicum (strain ATCC 13032 / DSM 20300 / JCM 1318 / BCRC 11384 / CCUG 27702 / LMG 3730 / NBRC 12168 / NCIMB 10025 / NRRL B-2784 / 534) TaxID=196627 RepID=Q8NNT2_CORGL|nr:hypothetical protein [Corynebacterium glutamicum]AGT05840.1 putative secreted protein [Corynebacterium glutamicum MB001]AIK88327.1 hypothetical protein AR0_09995 [Corynebacterium glutamicum]ARV63849.1 hypothetical protein B7P23_02595 [Corynebacterium glutamicum]ASW14490.1 putative secreted protein [Corynebacterium glutamicum]AUI01560.1 hypothetical protein CYL77_10585 [Corynebacterium glutamicum]